MDTNTDVIVVGGNPGGCSAAIAAARSGLKVLLLESTRTLGGINANGVFGFDCAAPAALSSIAEEVGLRIRAHYERAGMKDPLFDLRSDQVWESHVAARAWHDIVDETEGITLVCGAVPVALRMEGRRIREVHWQRATDVMGNIKRDGPRHVARSAIVIDASYEGDVTAWSGAPLRMGREPRSALEPHAGEIFTNDLEASADGLLPHSILPGSSGSGDDSIMAFACRLHCRLYDDPSPDAAHRIKAPPGYDPGRYEWKPLATRPDGSPVYFAGLYVLVNGKFLLNRMVKGNELVGPNREYILAHPAERRELRQRFVDHALGYLYYIQTEGGLPALGLANDEFEDNGHIPYQLYIREGRRIVGQTDMTEADVNPFITGDGIRPPRKPDAVAIGDWTYESHVCRDDAPPGYRFPEGWIMGRVSQSPYQIPYGSLLPMQVDNLLVAGPVSATHMAFGAIRCEAARIQIGIAAGVAAGLALRRRCTPAEVPVNLIQDELIARKGKLTYFADVASDHPQFAAIQWAALRGLVPADRHWRFEPDRLPTWAEFAQAVVTTLQLPISVTGAHFERVDPHEPAFRYFESLYDLGTRAAVDLFDVRKGTREDPIQDFLRLDRRPKRIPLLPGSTPSRAQAAKFLGMVTHAARGAPGQAVSARAELDDPLPLTRATMCVLLKTASLAG